MNPFKTYSRKPNHLKEMEKICHHVLPLPTEVMKTFQFVLDINQMFQNQQSYYRETDFNYSNPMSQTMVTTTTYGQEEAARYRS